MARDPDARIVIPDLGRTPAAEMDMEIEAHLQLAVDDLVRGGMEPVAARVEAERRLQHLRHDRPALHRAARKRETALRHRDFVGALRTDVKFAVRQMRRNVTPSLLAVAMLAIGIGMSTAMFTLVERVLLNPLPFPRADQLVHLQGRDSLRQPVEWMSNDDWLDWAAHTHSFAAMSAYAGPSRESVAIGDSTVRLTIATVSVDFFRVLGSRFVAGRPFAPDEVTSGAAGVVVSERFWREYLGADPALRVAIGAPRRPVIGVVADGAGFPEGVDIWEPVTFRSYGGGATRSNIGLVAIARLKVDVTLPQASADLDQVAHAIRARDPRGLYDYGGNAVPLQSLVVEGDTRSSFRLLMECVLLVLLIVCANFTVMTLGRGAAREQEFAVRASLGAARGRLVVQLLVEQVIMAVAGGIGGIVVAFIAIRVLVHSWGDSIPRAGEVHLDLPVLGFAIGLSLLVGLLAGIVPAVRGSQVALHGVLKGTGQNALGGKQRATTVLVVAEFAVALMLVTGAGLLLRSFQQLLGRDLGFDPGVATIEVALTGEPYASDSLLRLATWDRLIAAYRAIPSVQGVGVANWIPLATAGATFLDIDGRDAPNPGAGYRTVSDGYFEALDMHTVAGRVFRRDDGAATERVVVINRTMASQYWPGEDPIGKRVRARSMEAGSHGEPAPWLTVIGVVSDVRQYGLEWTPKAEMYTLFRQSPQWRTAGLTAVVRASIPPEKILASLRAATRSVDPRLAGDVSTLTKRLAGFLSPRRITMSLLSGFALLALLLAAIGSYAVLSFGVVRRRRELAMRAALGAQRSDLLRLVIWSGVRTAAIGIAIGLVAALVLSRIMESMLVDVHAIDPVTFVAAPALLLVAALAATVLPAARAGRLNPLDGLRGD